MNDTPSGSAPRSVAGTSGTAFVLYRCAGSPLQLGREHGEQARAQIHAHLDLLCASLALSRAALGQRAAKFLPLLNAHCPHLLTEIEGLAQGAAVTVNEALAVNVRAALGLPHDGGCTAFAVAPTASATGTLLIGQNSDTVPEVQPLAYVLELSPVEHPAILMWTFGGMIGYHGMNALGVAHFANDLGGGPPRRFGMPHYPVKRRMLECRTVAQAAAALAAVPLASNGNYVLGDGHGTIADIEATTEGTERLTAGADGIIVHANHFLGTAHATTANHARSAPDSFFRQTRMTELLQAARGRLHVDHLKCSLRDRAGAPAAICRSPAAAATDNGDWQTAGITVASIVAEPARGQLHIAAGNDPRTPYTTYTLSGR